MQNDVIADYANERLRSVAPGTLGEDNGAFPVYFVCVGVTGVTANLAGSLANRDGFRTATED